MLVLGRRPGEGVVIGDNIVVKLIEVDGNLKLSIDAPREVRIVRTELYEAQKAKEYMNPEQ